MKSLWGHNSPYLRIKRSSDLNPRLARALVIAAISLVAIVFIAGDVGLWRLWKAQKELKNLRAKIEDLERRNAFLRAEIERLEKDPFAAEKVAREKYGYVREGDRVYRIVTPGDRAEMDMGAMPRALDRSSLKR